jgi:hypothetical protein
VLSVSKHGAARFISRPEPERDRSARSPSAALLLAPAARAEPTSAPDYLASIRPSPELQDFLDHTVDALLAADPALRRADLRVALLDLGHPDAPRLAQR